ncbi:MAG: ABC transporter ATP-binding protein [Roseimicrobium sp.]
MIAATSLTKYFTRTRAALDDVSFEVQPAEILGLLGHNGAGKSTVLGIMLGMVRPDSGEVRIAGNSVQRDRAKALRQVGAIFEAPSFYEYMTGWQNLRALCALSGWWEEREVKRVLEIVRLSSRIHSKVRTYSLGMWQRLALAQALLPMPQVLLLDEPTDGLDPEGIHEFRSTVLGLRDEHGLTILLNSHLLSEVEHMCDRCVILREGRKIYEGALKRAEAETPRYKLQSPDMERARNVTTHLGQRMEADGTVQLLGGMSGAELVAKLTACGVRVEAWTPDRKTLEDVYLELTGTQS